MGKKDKKDKADSKKAKLAEKKAKQANKAEKKAKNKAAKDDSDAEDIDLDEVLNEYKRQQEQFLKVTETICEAPPRARSASTLMASPCNRNNLLLFGGEYFNGAMAHFFNDLHIYNIDRDEWRCVTSPNTPLPRSGHAWTRASNPNHVYLFGGEFSSPKQGTFHHYSDFWRLEPAAREWTKIECKGKTPPARSGHRMTYWKHYIVLFGGFQDTSSQTKYLADIWLFDTQNYMWHSPSLPTAQLKPDARSSFTLLPHEGGAVLFGGYSRVKTAVAANKQSKGHSQGSRNILKPMIHQDCFLLRMTLPAENSPANTPPGVRWERRKKPANTPMPSRAGATMTFHQGRGIMFGGVHDVELTEEGMDSEFFNQMFAWNIERNRFFPLALRKPRANAGKKSNAPAEPRVNRRGRAQAAEDELLRNLAALENGVSLENADQLTLDKREEEKEEDIKPMREMVVTNEFPHARFNAQLAVQDDVLYVYGGTFEKGDREYTLDDLYAIDLGKMDGCKEIFRRENEDWVQSEDEDDDDDDDDEDDEEEEEDDDDDDEQPAVPLITPSKRGKKPRAADGAEAEEASTSVAEEEETEATTIIDDGLPYPRPFESRRDFFARTTNEWQDILIAKLQAKGGEGAAALTVKELKTSAFELSESKWWGCREEIAALEEEQEAAGITEVPMLARSFQTSAACMTAGSTALPARKPVGAFRGGLFGFLLGTTLAGASVYGYLVQEYTASNAVLSADIYALQQTITRVDTLLKTLDGKVGALEKKKN
ncbi:Kelch repeat-containing protein 3 [Ceratocystis platani]|uniref:Kelch repeat-containing protein 3 n=1 Tax=Ceratocystis fimbriata f. sp. platani TaxID=88771 RepID=A0A0F8B4B8_CERFI|nr:Kelch repeat-containing protein 3 [Ceratocystis platani]